MAHNEIEKRTNNYDDDNHHEINHDDKNDHRENDYNDNEPDNHDHNSDKNEEQQIVYLEGLSQACLEFYIALLYEKAH